VAAVPGGDEGCALLWSSELWDSMHWATVLWDSLLWASVLWDSLRWAGSVLCVQMCRMCPAVLPGKLLAVLMVAVMPSNCQLCAC
jgi:hypothetical protein